ncbi:g4389 [Coccomyxa viridis]|uniref:G4389 protein n=1 Tax=Coccomyxa viridis TaxID=1274662 RepID=A0ABP1FVF9_9CHLO
MRIQVMMHAMQTRGKVGVENTSLWGCLSRVEDQSTGKPLSGDLLQAEVAGIILGGLDTTAQTCAFTLALLAAHPEKADTLAAELDNAGLLAKPERPQPRGMVYSDLPTLTYLDGVLRESLRMFPVAATGLSRCTDEDCVLGGYHIPAGTEVQVPIYTIHMLTFKAPESFLPERWANKAEESQANEQDNTAFKAAPTTAQQSINQSTETGFTTHGTSLDQTELAQAFIPFSSGPRDCLGQRLAMMEAATIIGTLLGRFTVHLASRMGGYEGVTERQTVAFTLAVDDGLWMRFTPRNGWTP